MQILLSPAPRIKCAVALESNAQWRVHDIYSGSGYRRAKLNGVCAQLAAGSEHCLLKQHPAREQIPPYQPAFQLYTGVCSHWVVAYARTKRRKSGHCRDRQHSIVHSKPQPRRGADTAVSINSTEVHHSVCRQRLEGERARLCQTLPDHTTHLRE